MMSPPASQAVSNDAADTTTTRVADRTVCCTLPPYRLVKSAPAQLILATTAARPDRYLMVATSSPDICASCGAQLPQSCWPPAGMSKWPLLPPTER